MKLHNFILLFILSLSGVYAQNAPPFVTYAGQVASGGQPFNGTGQFKFAFVNADANVTYWSHDNTSSAGSEPTAYISVPVNGGYYSILLGNTAMSGMGAINPSLFKTYSDIHLRVWFSDGVAAFQEMAPHRPFASVPYALNAGVAVGSITKSMLGSDVLADLNRTITVDMLSPTIKNDLNRTITKSMLGSDVLADLNATPLTGSITTTQLNEEILKYLKPKIIQSPRLPPEANGQVFTGQQIILSSQADGRYLSYQWKKDGIDLSGETNATLTIPDANASQHDGNYTLVVSNDFGSVEQNLVLDVNESRTYRTVPSAANMAMIWVEPGTFTMGSPTTETGRSSNETEHDVSLTKGFYLGKYEVTQAQYEAVMSGNTNSLSATPSNWPNNPNRPVEKVSWDDVQIFLTRLNASEQAAGRLPSGWSYVLPTESQWEYACRAGTTTVYSWGDTIDGSKANYSISGLSQTTDVGQYTANPWGFSDMHGNVYEWTADRYGATYPTGNPVVDPTGEASGSDRVLRGGSWGHDGTSLRSAERNVSTPSTRSYTIGFRVGFQQQ